MAHTDRGSQYVSIRYTERLAQAGITASVGTVGDSFDTQSMMVLWTPGSWSDPSFDWRTSRA